MSVEESVQMNVRVEPWMKQRAGKFKGGPSAYVKKLIEEDLRREEGAEHEDSSLLDLFRAQLAAKDSQIRQLQSDLNQAQTALIDINKQHNEVAKDYNENIRGLLTQLNNKEQLLLEAAPDGDLEEIKASIKDIQASTKKRKGLFNSLFG